MDGLSLARNIVQYVLLVLGPVLAIVALSQMLRERRSPTSAMAWLLAIVIFPIGAVPLYLFLGGRKMKQHQQSKTKLNLVVNT